MLVCASLNSKQPTVSTDQPGDLERKRTTEDSSILIYRIHQNPGKWHRKSVRMEGADKNPSESMIFDVFSAFWGLLLL